MASAVQKPSEENTIFESLGPRFFSRVFEEEENKGKVDDPDATPCKRYFIELSVTGLGFFILDDTENVRPEKIGCATISITETRFQKPDDNFKSCTIEQLAVEAGDSLTDTGAFAAILRRIQSLCFEKNAEHLGMTGTESHRWSSGLLKQAGFNLCECELLYKAVPAGFQLCMDLPSRRADSPASKEKDSPRNGAPIREGDDVVVAANNTQPAANTANIGDSFVREKTHCQFWILRGECAYVQLGCKYKHEIPVTQAEFDRIGLRKVPPWFKRSQYWWPWLQRVPPGERDGLINGTRNMDISTAQPSGPHSGPWANNASSRGGGNAAMTTRDPASLGPYTGQPSYEDHYRNSIASNIGAEASLAGPSSASNIGNTQAVNTTGGRRPDREVYRPPGRAGPSGGSAMQEPTGENSEVRGTNVEGHSRGRARRRYRHQSPGHDSH